MKNIFLKIMPVLIISIILSSCGTMGQYISDDYSFDPKNNMGLIAVSASLDDKCGSVGTFASYIRKVTKSGGGTPLMAKNFLLSPDFQNPYGHFSVIELPMGDYKISGATVTGLTLVARNSAKDTGFEFSVLPNQITYIGEAEYTVEKSCNSYTYKLKNSWKRDRKLFASRVPNIKPDSVMIQLARGNQ